MRRSDHVLTVLLGVVIGVVLATSLLWPRLRFDEDVRRVKVADLPAATRDFDCDEITRTAWTSPPLQGDDVSANGISAFVRRTESTPSASALHTFGVYGGTPRIRIGAAARHGTLLLSSYEPTQWTIDLEPTATVARIIVAGNVSELRIARKQASSAIEKVGQFLTNTPIDGIAIERVLSADACHSYAYDWQDDQRAEFRSFVITMERTTGSPVVDFQGAYSPKPIDTPFTLPLLRPQTVAKQTPVPVAPSPKLSPPSPAAPPPPANGGQRIHSVEELLTEVTALIDKGILPSGLPTMDHANSGGAMTIAPIKTYLAPIRSIAGKVDCPAHRDSAIEGGDGPDVIECSFGDNAVYAGGDKDLINDSWGNDILYGGAGNDTLDAGWGSDILIFELGWGNDTVDKTCHNSDFDPESTFGGKDIDYKWHYTNFIVFGPGIRMSDMHWEGNKLVHSNGDSIEFIDKNTCFNFVFADGETAANK